MNRTVAFSLTRVPRFYALLLKMLRPDALERQHYLRLLRAGDVVFDVGANVGDLTILFSDLIGPTGQLHSFEPVPPTYKLLTERIEREARFDNIRTNSFACSDESGVVEMLVPANDLGQASMTSHTEGSWTAGEMEKYVVPKRRLDDYVAENRISRIDFMKCDAEGAELLVLKGASELIRRFQPMLHLEFADFWCKDFGYTSSDLANHLLRLGFSDFLIEDERVSRDRLVERLSDSARKSVNILCANPGKADLLAKLN